jgi:hypothetical protein
VRRELSCTWLQASTYQAVGPWGPASYRRGSSISATNNSGTWGFCIGVKWDPADWRVSAPSATTSSATVAAQAADAPLALPDKPSIAVLPFQNMSGDPEQEYFTDGITEDVMTELARFRSLFVIARNSSFTYKGKAMDVRTVGREMGSGLSWKAVAAKRRLAFGYPSHRREVCAIDCTRFQTQPCAEAKPSH